MSFTEYFHLLLTGSEPTEDQRFFLDALLIAIAEHGLMTAMEEALGDAYSEPAADVRGYIDYVKSQ